MYQARRFASAFASSVFLSLKHTSPKFGTVGNLGSQQPVISTTRRVIGNKRARGLHTANMQTAEDNQTRFREFLASRKSLVLATVSSDGEAHASTAPFVRGARGEFFVMVSGLSAHTGHLAARKRASMLLAADESETEQMFARTRASFDCGVELVPRDKADAPGEWNEIADNFATEFGNIVGVLRDLQDFCIFRLTPTKGRYVSGFGKAFDVDTKDWSRLVHVGGPSQQTK